MLRGRERHAEEMRPPGPTEFSRGVLESLVDASRDRLGISGHLLRERYQLLGLFAQHLELLAGVRRPQLDNSRARQRGSWMAVSVRATEP